MNLYIPKRNIENIMFILEEFINTHESSESSKEDVTAATDLLGKINKEYVKEYRNE